MEVHSSTLQGKHELTQTGEARLLKLPYRRGSEEAQTLPYVDCTDDLKTSVARPDAFDSATTQKLSSAELNGRYGCHHFAGDTFRASTLEVNGRKGRRVVCVVSEDGLQFKTYDLDSGAGDDDQDDGQDGDLEMSQ